MIIFLSNVTIFLKMLLIFILESLNDSFKILITFESCNLFSHKFFFFFHNIHFLQSLYFLSEYQILCVNRCGDAEWFAFFIRLFLLYFDRERPRPSHLCSFRDTTEGLNWAELRTCSIKDHRSVSTKYLPNLPKFKRCILL